MQRIRGRVNGVGAALQAVKRGMGAAAGALDVQRANVGDIGFNLDDVDLAMSPVSERLLDAARLRRHPPPARRELSAAARSSSIRDVDRRCFPSCPMASARCSSRSSCPNKAAAADALRAAASTRSSSGTTAVGDGSEMSAERALPPPHVLELPIHQDLTPRHIEHVARQVSNLQPEDGPRDAFPQPQRSRRVIGDAGHRLDAVDVSSAIDSSWGFTALRAEWNALLRDSAADSPVPHVGMAPRLVDAPRRLVAASDRSPSARTSELIAIAPFRLTSNGRWRCFSRLEFLGTGDAGSDYLDVIVRRGCEAESVRATRHVSHDRRTRRFVSTHLAPIGAGRAACAISLDGATAGRASSARTATVPSSRWPATRGIRTWRRSASSHRANVRRRLRALEQKFDVRFERVTTEAQRREALAALVAFHERRYVGRGGSTAFSTPAAARVPRRGDARALDRGWLRMYVLRARTARRRP